MLEENLEYRMYGFVPYQLTGMQKGIQYNHAAMKYARKYRDDEEYIEWIDRHVTSIVLNGGTTNSANDKNYGSMNQILDVLLDKGIKCDAFYEPDLGNQLTGIVLIVDERVFNHAKWPFFSEFMKGKIPTIKYLEYFKNGEDERARAKIDMEPEYKEWVKVIGGENNAFLKEYLSTFKLA